MTIDPAMILPAPQSWSDGGKGRLSEGDAFARILASLDPQLAAEAVQATSSTPRIGSQAHAFLSRPLLLQTPDGLNPAEAVSGAAEPADENGFNGLATSAPLVFTFEGESLSSLLRQIRQFVRAPESAALSLESIEPDLQLSQSRAIGMPVRLENLASPAKLAGPGKLAPRNAPLIPIAAVPKTPLSRHEEVSPLQSTTAAPARTTPRATPQPFSAILLRGAEGLQLVIRMPEVSPDVRVALEDRIARLFARRGLATPATLITGPEAGSNERTS